MCLTYIGLICKNIEHGSLLQRDTDYCQFRIEILMRQQQPVNHTLKLTNCQLGIVKINQKRRLANQLVPELESRKFAGIYSPSTLIYFAKFHDQTCIARPSKLRSREIIPIANGIFALMRRPSNGCWFALDNLILAHGGVTANRRVRPISLIIIIEMCFSSAANGFIFRLLLVRLVEFCLL